MSSESFKPPVNKWSWNVLGPPSIVKKPMNIKVKALIQAPVMALVGYLIYHFFDHLIGPVIVWVLAGAVLVGGLFIPPLFHAVERFGVRLGAWVVVVLNWVLLTPFFYLCFFPGRLLLAVRKIDPMDRKFPDDRASFWIPRKPVADLSQYRKQH